MKVKELIAELEKFDGDDVVVCHNAFYSNYEPVEYAEKQDMHDVVGDSYIATAVVIC